MYYHDTNLMPILPPRVRATSHTLSIEKPYWDYATQLGQGKAAVGIRLALDTMQSSAFELLASYLLDHEADIAAGINDFGDLRPLFIHVHNREPR